jgi:ectoine hydroxylase-related dioxygenase (phytanoyl-CoA dioxygenase family)
MDTLSPEEVQFFQENGYIKLEQMYSPEEVEEMGTELDYIMEKFASWDAAWKGPWRKDYMDDKEDEQATLVAIHELQHYSAAWSRAVTKRELGAAVGDLLRTDAVELHHVTLHAKPPDKGAPFPMHQDLPFFPHADNRYVDCLVHLNDADENSGCIKFLQGSHKNGKLKHITGEGTAPHLPTDQYRLEDAISVPAKAGDVVLFTLWTIHGSAVNHSTDWRRLVRLGFRDPRNMQEGGQAMGRPGLLVKGVRPKIDDVEVDVYGNWSK